MRRKLFMIAASLSLVLCLVSAGMWVLSYRWWPCQFSAVRDLFDGTLRDGQDVVELSSSGGGTYVLLRHQWHDGPRMNFLTQLRSPEWGVGFLHFHDGYPKPINEVKVRLGF